MPLPTTQKELRGWMGLCNQFNHYVPELAGKQTEFMTLLKKNIQVTVTPQMEAECESAKKTMGSKNLLKYSALEFEPTCAVWSLETLTYCLQGCPQFDLWTDCSPLSRQ